MIGFELQRALEAFDLERWTAENGFERAGRVERATACPRCAKDDKLVVNVEKRTFKCWVCFRQETRSGADGRLQRVTVAGAGGVVRLVAWYYGCTNREAVAWLIAQAGSAGGALSAVSVADIDVAVDAVEQIVRVPPPPPEGAAPLSGHNLQYLATRGLTADVARAYGLFGCDRGRYAGRVVFPAWGKTGELLYWQARATWPAADDEAKGRRHVKVLNPTRSDVELTSEHTVFNLFRAAAIGRGTVCLCEGPVSAIRAGDDAVALWGKRLYPAQLREILRAGVTTVEVMFDGPTEREPEGAWADAVAIAPYLALFFSKVYIVRVPSGDPGDYDRAANAYFRKYSTFEATGHSVVARIE